jgi:hypothetical protein
MALGNQMTVNHTGQSLAQDWPYLDPKEGYKATKLKLAGQTYWSKLRQNRADTARQKLLKAQAHEAHMRHKLASYKIRKEKELASRKAAFLRSGGKVKDSAKDASVTPEERADKQKAFKESLKNSEQNAPRQLTSGQKKRLEAKSGIKKTTEATGKYGTQAMRLLKGIFPKERQPELRTEEQAQQRRKQKALYANEVDKRFKMQRYALGKKVEASKAKTQGATLWSKHRQNAANRAESAAVAAQAKAIAKRQWLEQYKIRKAIELAKREAALKKFDNDRSKRTRFTNKIATGNPTREQLYESTLL